MVHTWVQQMRMAEKMMNEADLEKDVGQNLMQLLGGQAKRRRSSASSLASDESMLSNRYCLACGANLQRHRSNIHKQQFLRQHHSCSNDFHQVP